MRFVIQRVNKANIKCFDIKDNLIHETSIGKGLVIYVGICKDDIQNFYTNKEKILKILKFPLFDNTEGKIKFSIQDVKGEILLIPNFTLYGRNKKGVNIDYTYSASFKDAKIIFNELVGFFKENIDTQYGIFGSYMKINQEVDGPVNFIYEV